VEERAERIVDVPVKRKTRGGSEKIYFEGEKSITLKDSHAIPSSSL
jgi:hypothetical protein